MYFELLSLPSKNQRLLKKIFTFYNEFLDTQLFELLYKHKEAKRDSCLHVGLFINGYSYRLTHFKDSVSYYEYSIEFLHPSLQEEGDKFVEYVNRCEQDMRFINQWLSIAINSLDVESVRKRLPDFIAKLDERYANSTLHFCEIPEGKEAMWKKAEALAKYYLGYQLLV